MDDISGQRIEDRLTQRELEIVGLVARGLTNQEIADELFIAFETVKWYLKQIYGKLHVSNRAQAIAATHAAGLLDGTTTVRELPEPRHTLPRQPTPFVGRTTELAQLREHLNDPGCRLLTVMGLGGMGKTRLATEAAAAQLPRFRDGVYFMALAPLDDPNQIPNEIAEVLRLSFAPGQPLKAQLFSYLHDKQMLLVLDNIEHLLAGAGLVQELLQAAPASKIIVTSRERLLLQSEVVFRLGGLDFAGAIAPDAAGSSAAQLFLQSARNVKPSFELTQDSLDALRSICRLMRGMPLGILLAASWLDTLSITEIAQEIERSFEFLDGQWRDLPERQRSLTAVFAHSWKLLTEAERSAMRCFSIFRGGFTRESAEQVATASLTTLAGLVNKSLLTRDASGRFDVHELLLQYSASELDKYPDERQGIQARHANYYANFMHECWIPIRSATMEAVLAEIEVEIDNIRSAWHVMVDQSQFRRLLMVARVLWYFLMVRARYEEGLDLFGRAANKLHALPPGEARDLALGEVLHNLGFFLTANGQPDKGKELAEESLARLQGHQAEEMMARAYITLCRSEFLLGEYHEMKIHTQRGIAVAQLIPDPWYRGPCLFLLGMAEVQLGNYDDGLRAGEEALDYLGKAGDAYYQGLCSSLVLGRAALRIGRYTEAKQFYLRSLAYFESIHDHFEIAQANRDLSEVYAFTKEYDASKRACKTACATMRERARQVTSFPICDWYPKSPNCRAST